MRIAVGQIAQESNTFNRQPTLRDDFERFGVFRGDELLSAMRETNEIGGFLDELALWPERPQPVGLVRAFAWPSGAATAETFHWLRRELVESLSRAAPVDGVLLALHGAMTAEGAPDVEGELLAAARNVLGPRVPLVATLDLHALVTPAMLRHASAVVLYHTAPHIDVFETGRRGAALARRLVVERRKATSALVRIPIVVPAEMANTQDPASASSAFKQRLVELESRQDVFAAGLATVQPWLDVPQLGSAVVVVSDESLAETAAREAEALAADVWRRRHDYLPELVPIDEAVGRAHANPEGLVVLSDSADATTSGAAGDGTAVLAELLKYDWQRDALITLVSPEVVANARSTGVGGILSTDVGGLRDSVHARPLAMRAVVKKLFQARFVMSGHLSRKLPVDMGPSAVLCQRGVHLVVTTHSGPHFAPQLFETAGLDPYAAAVVVAKSPCGFRAAYAARARWIDVVRSPGCAPPDFWHYDYGHIERPLWPWDEIDSWRPRAEIFQSTSHA